MFGIWCEVWGGVTGSRSSWMKRDDVVVEFATEEEAQAEADRLMEAVRSRPFSSVSFRYSARRM